MKLSRPSRIRITQFIALISVVLGAGAVLWQKSHQIITVSENWNEDGAYGGQEDVLAKESVMVSRLDEALWSAPDHGRFEVRHQDNSCYVRFEVRIHGKNSYVLVYTPGNKVLNNTLTTGGILKWSETYHGVTLEKIRQVAKKKGTLELFKASD